MSVFDDYDLEACTRVDAHGIRWMRHGLSSLDWLRTRWKLRRTHPTAKEYLTHYPDDFPWAHFVGEHGTVCRTGSYPLYRELMRRDCFLPSGQCYQNALAWSLKWAEDPPDWLPGPVQYMEGLYLDPEGAFPHAWVEAGGVAYETSLPTGYLASYIGVGFAPACAHSLTKLLGRYGLLANWSKSQLLLQSAASSRRT